MPFYDLIYKKLGFSSDSQIRTYNDLVGLFTSSDRGESAINIFTNNIMEILISRDVKNKEVRKYVDTARQTAKTLHRKTYPGMHHVM